MQSIHIKQNPRDDVSSLNAPSTINRLWHSLRWQRYERCHGQARRVNTLSLAKRIPFQCRRALQQDASSIVASARWQRANCNRRTVRGLLRAIMQVWRHRVIDEVDVWMTFDDLKRFTVVADVAYESRVLTLYNKRIVASRYVGIDLSLTSWSVNTIIMWNKRSNDISNRCQRADCSFH